MSELQQQITIAILAVGALSLIFCLAIKGNGKDGK